MRAGDDADPKRVLKSDTLIAPDDLVDKEGSPVMLGRLRHNDMMDGRTVEDVCRMIIYTIDRVLERETAQIHGVTVFHDLAGMSTKSVDKVYEVIDQDQLLKEHGGKRKHNSADWVAAQIERETDGTMVSLKECLVSSA